MYNHAAVRKVLASLQHAGKYRINNDVSSNGTVTSKAALAEKRRVRFVVYRRDGLLMSLALSVGQYENRLVQESHIASEAQN